MAKRRGRSDGGTVIIRREEIVASGHHGGAWKVAYADFVTAMMAFFLLMWLLNATTETQRRGIAAYFSPLATVENGFSGAGLISGGVSPLTGGTSLTMTESGSPAVAAVTPGPGTQTASLQNDPDAPDGGQDGDDRDGARKADQPVPAANDAPRPTTASRALETAPEPALEPGPAAPPALTGVAAANAAKAEQTALAAAASALRQRVASDPKLGASAGQMAIDVTPEGLRIQIMERDGQPMFERGAARLNDRAIALLRTVAPFLAKLPEPVSIGGYTDAATWPAGQAGQVSNWSLSSGRADAARDVLTASGLPDARIADVTGFADRRLLLPAEPMASANRRVVLTLHRQFPLPPAAQGG
jgi:chemotaxis protein MotB